MSFFHRLFGRPEPSIPFAEPVTGRFDGFLFNGEWLEEGTDFKSPNAEPNVKAIQYVHDEQLLHVIFYSGTAYQYANVPVDMARDLAESRSKGAWVWEHLRRPKWPFVVLTALSDKLPVHLRGKEVRFSQSKEQR